MDSETENQVTLRDLIYILFKHKTKILICFFSVVISVTLITGNKRPLYQANTSLLVKFGRENVYRNVTPDGTTSFMDYSSKIERMNTELAILRGNDLIKSVIEDIGIRNLYPFLLFMKNSDENTTPSITPIDRAISFFNFNLLLAAGERSNVIDVSFTHPNPVTAANAVNTLVDHYLVEHLRIFQQPEQLIFFENQLEKYKELLRESENDLKIFKKNNNVSALDFEKSDLLNKISNFKADIADTSVKISELEAKLRLLNSIEASGETSQLNVDAITSIRSKITTLKLTEQELLNRYNPNNIKIINIRAEIEAGEKLIASEEKTFFKKEKIGAQNELDALNSKLFAKNEYLTIFQNELDRLDMLQLELKDLERKVDINEASYELYAARTEEARISSEMDAQKMANITVIAKASPPLLPLDSKRTESILISIIMGLFLGIAAALVIEFFSHSFNDGQGIKKHLKLDVLASIPFVKAKRFQLSNPFK